MNHENILVMDFSTSTDILAVVSIKRTGERKVFPKDVPFKHVFQHVRGAWEADQGLLILLQDPATIESVIKQVSGTSDEPLPSRYALMDKVSLAKKFKRFLVHRKDQFPGAGFQVVQPIVDKETGEVTIEPEPRESLERITPKKEKPPVGRIVGNALHITQDELMAYLDEGFEDYMESEYMLACDTAEDLEIEEKYDEALKVVKDAIGMEPDREYAWHVKGCILADLQRYDEAMACFDKTLEMDPTYTIGYNDKGSVFHELGLHKQAIAAHDRTLEIIPSDGRALTGKGLALHGLGRSQEALDCFDEAIEDNPGYMPAWEDKMEVLSNLGRLDEMIAFCDSYIQEYPGEMIFKEYKEWVMHVVEVTLNHGEKRS